MEIILESLFSVWTALILVALGVGYVYLDLLEKERKIRDRHNQLLRDYNDALWIQQIRRSIDNIVDIRTSVTSKKNCVVKERVNWKVEGF